VVFVFFYHFVFASYEGLSTIIMELLVVELWCLLLLLSVVHRRLVEHANFQVYLI
jgi:hypothetical protein